MKKEIKFLKGAIILTISSLLAKIIGAFYRVPMISMIGSNGLGIFQLVFPIYTFFLIFVTGGIALGISKLISVEIKKGNVLNVKQYLKCSIVLMLTFSFLASFIILLLAFPLSLIQGNKDFFVLYVSLIPALIFSSLISCFRGYFQGKENMFPSGMSQIIEQIFKLLVGLFLASILIKKSLVLAVCGAFLGISISEVCSFIYLMIKYKLESKNQKEIIIQIAPVINSKACYRQILKTSFPIMLNSAILPFFAAVESIISIWLLTKAGLGTSVSTSLFGIQDGIIASLINLPIVIGTAISTALLPSLSKEYSSGKINVCEQKSKLALKYTWLIVLPCAFGFMFLSKDILLFLYNNGLSNASFDELLVASDLLKISSLNIIYISLLSVLTSILQAINKSYIPVKNLVIASVVKLIISIVLTTQPSINIYGIVISDIVCYSLALLLNFIALKKQLNIFYDFKNFILNPILASVLMVCVIGIIKFMFSSLITPRVLTLAVIFLGTISYGFVLVLTKTLNIKEFSFFKNIKKKRV